MNFWREISDHKVYSLYWTWVPSRPLWMTAKGQLPAKSTICKDFLIDFIPAYQFCTWYPGPHYNSQKRQLPYYHFTIIKIPINNVALIRVPCHSLPLLNAVPQVGRVKNDQLLHDKLLVNVLSLRVDLGDALCPIQKGTQNIQKGDLILSKKGT